MYRKQFRSDCLHVEAVHRLRGQFYDIWSVAHFGVETDEDENGKRMKKKRKKGKIYRKETEIEGKRRKGG